MVFGRAGIARMAEPARRVPQVNEDGSCFGTPPVLAQGAGKRKPEKALRSPQFAIQDLLIFPLGVLYCDRKQFSLRGFALSQVIPFSDLVVGQRIRLVRVDGGRRLQRRLLALGLSIGGEAELVQRRPGGVVLARGANRVALGEGVMQKLYAEVLD
jgi:ferrous iron transport protein A